MLRLCTVYQNLRAVTIRYSYAILRMEECINWLGIASIFSNLDGNSEHFRWNSQSRVTTKPHHPPPRIITVYTNAFWTQARPGDVSTRDGRPTNQDKMTNCRGLFGRYRDIFASARRAKRAFSSNSDVIERRKRDA